MLQGSKFMALIIFVTVFALFGEDSKYLIPTNSASGYQAVDTTFDIITILCLVIYTCEIGLQCFADKTDDEPDIVNSMYIWKYKWSFYFWLDIFSTATMILDITWLLSSIISNNGTPNSISNNLSIFTKTIRGVRIGSRAGRIVRIARLFRTERMYMLYNKLNQKTINVNMATIADV